MGISLNGLTPAGTYPGLIKTGDNTAISGTPKILSDGNGNNLPMEVSTTGVNFTNNLTQGGTALQPVLVSGTNIKTINGTSLLGSGNIPVVTSPSGVAGAIQFSNGSAFASDASNLFWDDTNNRLGVGTNAPSATTHIVGSGNTSATTALILQNSSGLEMLKVTNDSKFKIIPTALMPDVLFIEDFRFPGEKVLQLGTRNNAGHGAISSRSRMFIDAGIGAPGEYLIINSASGNNVGINETTPTAKLHIKGSGSTSATTSLLVQNSSSTTTFSVNDAGGLSLGSTAPKITLGGDLTITSTVSPTRQMVYDVANSNLSVYSGGVGEGFFIGNRLTTSRTSTTFVTPDALNAQGAASITAYDSNGNIAINASNNGNRSIALKGLGADGAVLIGNITTGNGSVYSAILRADSTTQGFLPPRMTTTQKNAIASPTAGLVVYDSTTNKLCCYNGSTWNDLF